MHYTMTKPHFEVRSTQECDEDIVTLSGAYDGETLMHSKRCGFYRSLVVHERLNGGEWQEITEGDWASDINKAEKKGDPHPMDYGTHRFHYIEKPVTLDQAMRLFLHGWQDEAGLFDAMRSALDRAGVEPLKM